MVYSKIAQLSHDLEFQRSIGPDADSVILLDRSDSMDDDGKLPSAMPCAKAGTSLWPAHAVGSQPIGRHLSIRLHARGRWSGSAKLVKFYRLPTLSRSVTFNCAWTQPTAPSPPRLIGQEQFYTLVGPIDDKDPLNDIVGIPVESGAAELVLSFSWRTDQGLLGKVNLTAPDSNPVEQR